MLYSRIAPGMMDLSLVFEQPVKSRNATSNELETTWAEIGKFAAYKHTGDRARGGTGFEASQEVTTNTDTFTLRYSSEAAAIDATCRFYNTQFPSEYYYVTLVDKVPREGRIHLEAERRDNG